VVRRIDLVESREFLAWARGFLCPVRLWRASNVDLPDARSRRRSKGYAKGGDESPEPLKLILEAVPQSRPVEAPYTAKP